MNILVDYLTVSVKQMNLDDMFHILKIDASKMQKGYSRYVGSRYFLGGISVHYGDYIILEMSGSGCRLLESLYDNNLNWIDFIEQFLCLEGSHLARLDIACDDYPGVEEKALLSMPTLFRYCQQNRYLSLARYCTWIDGAEQAIYFGSPKSDRRLRIYNKALERHTDGHWIRSEFQLRNDTALSFFMRALEFGSIGKAYQGMLYDFLRFTREENKGINQDRLHVTRWWKTFCGNAARIKGFYIGGLEYNMERLERYLSKNAGSSMKTLLACTGGDIGKLVKFAEESEYNEHQEFLVKTKPLIDKMNEDYKTEEEKAAEGSKKILECIGHKVYPKEEVTPVFRREMLKKELYEEKAKIRKEYCDYWGIPDPEEEEMKKCAAEDLPFD